MGRNAELFCATCPSLFQAKCAELLNPTSSVGLPVLCPAEDGARQRDEAEQANDQLNNFVNGTTEQ